MGLFGLVNNAGIVVAGALEFLPIAELRRQLEVNVVGQVAVTQGFFPLLRKARGRIVIMGSIYGRVSWPFLGPYAASKFALEALTDSLRLELKAFDISVSIIEPGSVATPIWNKSRLKAETFVAALPAKAHEFYGPAMAAVKEAAGKSAGIGIPSTTVAKAVAHALRANSPKVRYLLGWDARFLAGLKKYLPDRIVDWLILRVLYGRKSAHLMSYKTE